MVASAVSVHDGMTLDALAAATKSADIRSSQFGVSCAHVRCVCTSEFGGVCTWIQGTV